MSRRRTAASANEVREAFGNLSDAALAGLAGATPEQKVRIERFILRECYPMHARISDDIATLPFKMIYKGAPIDPRTETWEPPKPLHPSPRPPPVPPAPEPVAWQVIDENGRVLGTRTTEQNARTHAIGCAGAKVRPLFAEASVHPAGPSAAVFSPGMRS